MVHKQVKFASLCLLLFATGAIAQSVTGTGTANTVPLFTGSSTLGNSNITQLSGKVGIGTPTPMAMLDVGAPNAAIGGLMVDSGVNLDPLSTPSLPSQFQGSGKMLIGWNRSGGAAETDFISSNATSNTGGFNFYEYSNTGSLTQLMTLLGTGNVGIGTKSPGASLEVNGNLKLTAGSGASITFPDATVQSTAWNGTLPGGDYAESIDVLGDRTTYEPGDVIVIDDSETGKFHKSDKAYSKLVAGVFSTKPGLVGRRTTADRPDKESEVPMAMMGIVPTKVSAENGPIERGDLLVSSSRSGYAMKGTDRDRLIGAVIGKALAPLKSGSGVIEVLVSLQ